jgi:hypothetical protein
LDEQLSRHQASFGGKEGLDKFRSQLDRARKKAGSVDAFHDNMKVVENTLNSYDERGDRAEQIKMSNLESKAEIAAGVLESYHKDDKVGGARGTMSISDLLLSGFADEKTVTRQQVLAFKRSKSSGSLGSIGLERDAAGNLTGRYALNKDDNKAGAQLEKINARLSSRGTDIRKALNLSADASIKDIRAKLATGEGSRDFRAAMGEMSDDEEAGRAFFDTASDKDNEELVKAMEGKAREELFKGLADKKSSAGAFDKDGKFTKESLKKMRSGVTAELMADAFQTKDPAKAMRARAKIAGYSKESGDSKTAMLAYAEYDKHADDNFIDRHKLLPGVLGPAGLIAAHSLNYAYKKATGDEVGDKLAKQDRRTAELRAMGMSDKEAEAKAAQLDKGAGFGGGGKYIGYLEVVQGGNAKMNLYDNQ